MGDYDGDLGGPGSKELAAEILAGLNQPIDFEEQRQQEIAATVARLKAEAEALCANCGRQRQEHIKVVHPRDVWNTPIGMPSEPEIVLAVLCPTAVFEEPT